MCARLRYMHAHGPGAETRGLTVCARMYGAFLRHTVSGRSVSEGCTRPEHGDERPPVSGNGNNLNADRLVARRCA